MRASRDPTRILLALQTAGLVTWAAAKAYERRSGADGAALARAAGLAKRTAGTVGRVVGRLAGGAAEAVGDAIRSLGSPTGQAAKPEPETDAGLLHELTPLVGSLAQEAATAASELTRDLAGPLRAAAGTGEAAREGGPPASAADVPRAAPGKSGGEEAEEAGAGEGRETSAASAPETVSEPGSRGRGHLGITTYPVEIPQGLASALGAVSGLIVLQVEPDGPAAEAGLQLGDTLYDVEGQPLRRSQDLIDRIAASEVGQTIHAKILRAGEAREIALRVGARG